MKHTPGPWVAQPGDNFITDAREIVIAQMHRHHPDEQVDANARLIAAAPELLAALVELLPHAARVIQGTTEGQPLLDAARAAIAKATGDSNG
jgi:hypothetical protein